MVPSANKISAFFLCLYFYKNEGLDACHTPPTVFAIALIFLLLSVAWLVTDWVFVQLLDNSSIEFKTNYVGFFLNLLILIFVFIS